MTDKARLNPPGFTYFDTNGTPLASGKIYTYTEGTSNNKTTYTDEAGGTANANPVVLDSNGQADIWLDTDAGYKIVVKDSSDVTLSTTDNVFGIREITAADHDSLTGFVANEHIDHTAVTFTAGNGLTGGGDISANRTFDIDDNVTLPGTEGAIPPTGTTAQRAGSPTAGTIRYNSTTSKLEAYEGAAWVDLATIQASQSDQETGTDTTKVVTPGVQQYHPSAAKLYVKFNAAGTISEDYNVDSITDNGTGSFTVNITTDFSNALYSAVATAEDGNAKICCTAGYGAGSYTIYVFNDANASSDPSGTVASVAFGDQ